MGEFGDLSGIVVNVRTGHVVSGHQRVATLPAACPIEEFTPATDEHGTAGYGVVRASGSEWRVRFVDWPEPRERIANLAANAPTIQGEFTEDVDALVAAAVEAFPELAEELRLEDIEAAVGDDPPPEPLDADPQPDRAAELQEQWGVARGDVWLCPSVDGAREHRVLCGDATDAADVAKVMDGQKAALCLTDPPYGVGLNYEGDYKDDDGEAYYNLMRGFWATCNSIAPIALLTVGNKYTNWWFATYPPDAFLIWYDKTKQSPHKAAHLCKSELVLVFGAVNERYPWDTIEVQGVRGDGLRELHRCPKPLELFQKLAEPQLTAVAPIVFDPFLGSGTTLIAAENLGRVCYGIEIEPKYVAVCLQRYQDAFGVTPVRESDRDRG